VNPRFAETAADLEHPAPLPLTSALAGICLRRVSRAARTRLPQNGAKYAEMRGFHARGSVAFRTAKMQA
jgi:hypothetical protein